MQMTHLIMLKSLGDSFLICMGMFLLHYLLFICKRCMSQLSLWYLFEQCKKIHVWDRKKAIKLSFKFPSFKLWTESQATQTVSLTVSFLKRAWSFDVNILWNFYILSLLYFTCYCVHIFTVYFNGSYFNVYSKTIFICTYRFGFWVFILSFL